MKRKIIGFVGITGLLVTSVFVGCNQKEELADVYQMESVEQKPLIIEAQNGASSARLTHSASECSYPYSGTELSDFKWKERTLKTRPRSDTKYFLREYIKRSSPEQYFAVKGAVENLSSVPIIIRAVMELNFWRWNRDWVMVEGCITLAPGEKYVFDALESPFVREDCHAIMYEIIVPSENSSSLKEIKVNAGVCNTRGTWICSF